ncbi:very short patch repair endonuclease [Chryseobacterium arthrosphaerae]|nr:DNA mismatch endonuclease Vsr [Chryseobacterium arthrosphaerae]
MSKIKSSNTKPELFLRKFLFSKGLRYHINYKKLPGKPDIVFPKYKTVIFVNGCFWHGHTNCKIAHIPKTNEGFWINKINKNIERDHIKIQENILLGWKVIVVWECQIHKNNLDRIYKNILNVFSVGANENIFKIHVYENKDETISQVSEEIVKYKK